MFQRKDNRHLLHVLFFLMVNNVILALFAAYNDFWEGDPFTFFFRITLAASATVFTYMLYKELYVKP